MLLVHPTKKVVELELYSRDHTKLHLSRPFDSILNNQVKYEALVARLKLAHEMGVKKLKCHNDSQLVTSKINGDYQANEPLF